MINIQKMIEEANKNGYQGDKASAKACQDIVFSKPTFYLYLHIIFTLHFSYS